MRNMKINHQKNHLKSTIFLLLLISLKTRFEKLKTFESIFVFLYDSHKLKFLDDSKLNKCYVKFH